MDENEQQDAASARQDDGTEQTGAPLAEAVGVDQIDPQRARRARRRRRGIVAAIAGASVLCLGGTGFGVAATMQLAALRSSQTTTAQSGTDAFGRPSTGSGDSGSTGSGTTGGYGYGYGAQGTSPFGSSGGATSGSPGTSTSTATDATDAQSAGVVLVNTVLGYAGGEAAGTGIVLTSDGEILTNNHVVEGSTSITVTIASTGQEYTATVVGTDATDDIAVLQLEDASGLTVAAIDDDDDLAVGDSVTGVGNAEGQGYLSAAAGEVTALEQQITVSDELTGAAKSLDGLIETDAGIVSGDSGGPLLDAEGEVVGIDTAASSDTSNPQGYAIPIDDALRIADLIESGTQTSSIVIGYPAFLGVELSQQSSTATVAGVLDDTPAADAGVAAGDVITSVDGTAISTGDELSTAVAAHDPGDRVSITWTDAQGTSHSATVALVEGPAA